MLRALYSNRGMYHIHSLGVQSPHVSSDTSFQLRTMLTTSWKLVLLASLSVLHVSARGYKPTPTKPTPCPPSTTTTTTAPPPVTTPVPPECDIQVIYADPSCVDNANPSIECPAMTTTNGDCERNAVIRYRIQHVGDHPLVITSLINEIEVDGVYFL